MNNYRKQRRNQDADEWLRRFDEEVLREREFHKSSIPQSSGFTPESLKQAIDDAKEVRAQALRNAKKALEEAFSNRFNEVFENKLREEEK
jgi:hypothetical protein